MNLSATRLAGICSGKWSYTAVYRKWRNFNVLNSLTSFTYRYFIQKVKSLFFFTSRGLDGLSSVEYNSWKLWNAERKILSPLCIRLSNQWVYGLNIHNGYQLLFDFEERICRGISTVSCPLAIPTTQVVVDGLDTTRLVYSPTLGRDPISHLKNSSNYLPYYLNSTPVSSRISQ